MNVGLPTVVTGNSHTFIRLRNMRIETTKTTKHSAHYTQSGNRSRAWALRLDAMKRQADDDDVLFALHDGNLKHFPAVKSYYYFCWIHKQWRWWIKIKKNRTLPWAMDTVSIYVIDFLLRQHIIWPLDIMMQTKNYTCNICANQFRIWVFVFFLAFIVSRFLLLFLFKSTVVYSGV